MASHTVKQTHATQAAPPDRPKVTTVSSSRAFADAVGAAAFGAGVSVAVYLDMHFLEPAKRLASEELAKRAESFAGAPVPAGE
ncbi:hypothetical protein GobsT_71620 [Gemmata obscuriglobus]|nr:hypothetical protein GobsT_71620 [Gemmata obscuriglobus]VTS11665.1 unnamed protein product [Gemmata obscuriglobus UQM 2246]